MMSHPVSYTKIIYDPSSLRTPNIKEEVVSSSVQNEYEPSNPPILMDEYGQTPDHFYLARKPPTFFQVKRKLDLQASNSGETNLKPGRRRRKLDGTANPKAASISKPRYDTSLGQLTKKFLKLLTDASDGVINLNTACTLLSVPKRRLYDITNVLEGAGLIQKTSRNNVQYKGRVSSPSCSVVTCDLEREIDILEAKENKLDELIYNMKSEINSLKESEAKYLYVTSDEVNNIEEFSMKTLLGVRIASTGQIIEPSERKVVMTSKSSEMEAFLLTEDVSFINILHPRAEYKENAYKVQIRNSYLANFIKEEPLDESGFEYENESTYSEICTEAEWNEVLINGSAYSQFCSGTTWSEGDMVIKNAFIAEEDDIAPMGRNFLLQTEDQDLEDLPFSNLESHVDSYSFSLDDGEGLTDLFDCQFPSCS